MLLSLLVPGFLSVKETRISETFPVALGSFSSVGLSLLLMASFAVLFLSYAGFNFLMGLVGGIAPVFGFFLAGRHAASIASKAGPFARVSPSTGLWVLLLAGYIVVFAARRRLKDRKIISSLLVLVPIGLFLLLLGSGHLKDLQ
jgi:osmoprotectant transport system permease protein